MSQADGSPKRRSRRIILICLSILTGLGLIGALAAIGGFYALGAYYKPGLPTVSGLEDLELQVPLRIYTADGVLMREYGAERRAPLSYEQLPQSLIEAVLAAEDDRFFEHPGVDWQGLLRAVWVLATTGEKSQGGSTITMQLARNFFLTSERTYERKLREIYLALEIEKQLSKEEILERYLNKIFLGNRAYGVGAAAEVYYGKPAAELNLAQSAMIAGLPKAPSSYNPIANPERALIRRNYVLRRMRELGYINASQFDAAVSAPVTAELARGLGEIDADYVAEMLRADMVERYGDKAYTGGFHVRSTLDSGLQRAADRALKTALLAYDQRHGYRGPEARTGFDQDTDWADADVDLAWREQLRDLPTIRGLPKAVVLGWEEGALNVRTLELGDQQITAEGLEWADLKAGNRPSVGDVIRMESVTTDQGHKIWRLAQIPQVQGAFVALDPVTGEVKAMVGGFDYFLGKFNRAVQAQRQPGSAFKPLLYSAALANGMTPATVINDAPVVFDDPALEDTWRPENYTGRFYGPTRMREALVNSRNLVSIRLLRQVGIDAARDHISAFGLPKDRLPRDLSLALGSAVLSPLELARAYAVFANGGYLIDPFWLDAIESATGEPIAMPPRRIGCSQCPALDEAEPAVPITADAGQERMLFGEQSPEDPLPGGPGVDEPILRPAPQVIDAQNAWLMTSMMQDVVARGTARRARSLGRSDLAGKTGTTNDENDAWFAGYNAHLVGVAWIGFDQMRPLGRGEAGGRAALPMWIDFMQTALDGVPPSTQERPPGLVTVRIDPATGELATYGTEDAVFETFPADLVPKAPDHYSDWSRPKGDSKSVEDLF
ncbi:penicillin-binding protein 1A [Abyssibacter profundi]|uniref:Penicillin-binding protein 1A n=1 Tax=Abyssibacter profundi TaxID=2182787 RepID=A0A363UM31_9GAMM|nr:penicillin-binding protein 1A [Abyssibacter profundi]PWN56470.1 peptidase [Abyssibacter profundi]